jgi:serine/threonine protein phosphatase 1
MTRPRGKPEIADWRLRPRPSTGGALAYIVGDVHGCYDLLRERANGRRPLVVFCGDYVDRGADSAKVVEAVLQLQDRRDIQVHLLKGNHEAAMLDFVQKPADGRDWLGFGGLETLASYGVTIDGPPSAEALETARDRLLEQLPAAHLELLRRLELMLIIGDYAIVHAGVRPAIPLAAQSAEDVLWIRDDFILADQPFEKTIVHGHTWTGVEPQLKWNRIGIDTGAYETGVLTAVCLDERDVTFLQTSRPAPTLERGAPSRGEGLKPASIDRWM